MPIGQEKGGGTWWKVLLGVVGGFFLGIGAVAGGVAIAATCISTKTLMGEENAQKYIGPDYQDKTIMQIALDFMGGNVRLETLGDLNAITPLVGEYVSGIKVSLNDLGCELTDEEMMKWPLATLADNIIYSVKNAKLINVLSKDNVKYPDPIIKYLSYETKDGEYVWATDDNGEYILDEDGEHVLVDQRLTDMLDHSDYIQNKVDTMRISMLFKDEDIASSKLLSAIKDNTIQELSKNSTFNAILLEDVIDITTDSPAILQTFDRLDVTIGGMSEAINNMTLDDVMVLKPGDMLYNVRTTPINKLNTINEKLTVDDVMPGRPTTGIMGALDGSTTVDKIGDAVNDMTILKAFDEQIFSGTGSTLNATWKYMLIEAENSEVWFSGSPAKSTDPFSGYNCESYKVGSDIGKLVDNMKYNMSHSNLLQLDQDQMVDMDDTWLGTEMPSTIKGLVPTWSTKPNYEHLRYGDLNIEELATLAQAMSEYLSTHP